MAIALELFRREFIGEKADKNLNEVKQHEGAEECLIDIKALNITKGMEPLVKNVNTFISLKEFERASLAADKIIEEYPDSAVGWYAKSLSLTDNFAHNRIFEKDLNCGFLKYKQNALKLVDDNNRSYIRKKYDEYEKAVISCTETGFLLNLQLYVMMCFGENSFLKNSSIDLGVLTLRSIVNTEVNLEELVKAFPDNLIFCYFYYLHTINSENFKNQLEYYGVTKNDKPYDYYKKRAFENMPLSKETMGEFFKKNGLNPGRSADAGTDGYISCVTTLCKLLQIDPGDPKLYYSDDALKEIEQMELEEEQRVAEEKRRIAEEERLAREAERKREEERQQRIAEEKAKERRNKIIKFSVACVIIAVAAILISNFGKSIGGFENLFGSNKYSDFTEAYEEETENKSYYIMASDCTAINLRKGPGTNYGIVTTLKSRSVKLTPTGKENGEWIQVKNDKYGTCWVYYNLVDYVAE